MSSRIRDDSVESQHQRWLGEVLPCAILTGYMLEHGSDVYELNVKTDASCLVAIPGDSTKSLTIFTGYPLKKSVHADYRDASRIIQRPHMNRLIQIETHEY